MPTRTRPRTNERTGRKVTEVPKSSLKPVDQCNPTNPVISSDRVLRVLASPLVESKTSTTGIGQSRKRTQKVRGPATPKYEATYPLESLVRFYDDGWRVGYLESYESRNKFVRVRQIGGNPAARRAKVLTSEIELA